MQKEQEVKAFKLHLSRLGYSKSSIHMLPNCVREFLQYQPHHKLQDIQSTDIIRFKEYLQERPHKRRAGGLSERYINHHMYSLKLFFRWQQEKGRLPHNPISTLDFKTPISKPREILTQNEIKQLYNATETYKERAIISLFYGCGLRRTEGEKLNLKDLHFRANLLYVREGKNKKRRAVPLSNKVKTDLQNYIYKERSLSLSFGEGRKGEDTAIILNQTGKRMRGNCYNKTLKEILSRTPIQKEISLHSLRHSIATHLLESGLSVEYVRDFLGHKNLESTQVYTRINKQQVWSLSTI